ncbi:anti-sigma-V factor RsiV [Paenibacillus sp. CCS19]|uniref:RsiV family protein n=1 Tax=Paenibacillus sp. CCS19 TaxID=3158387 RepID=UPI00256149B7|nr:RsiV family protein [Paenibacillus cellulosilyticus]GMK38855.1 anti-sigma-V factor RsiV [Paenibacillus cellulosilyticus]
MNPRLEQLKEQYSQIPIPEELNVVVLQALNRGSRRRTARRRWISAAAAALLIVLAGINASPAVANAFASIPGIGQWVKVVTIREYVVDEERHNADIKVPEISNLGNDALSDALNEKYLAEGKQLYEQFQKDMEELKDGHLGVDAGYIVKTDTEDLLAIERYVVISMGSSEEKLKYDTVDKRNHIVLTLPMLFKNDQYVQAISNNIIEQMKQRMIDDPNQMYWVEDAEADISADETFKTITPDHNFYIDASGHLIIVFDKYEVGPGYMGVQQFTIPTAAIADLLTSSQYIK